MVNVSVLIHGDGFSRVFSPMPKDWLRAFENDKSTGQKMGFVEFNPCIVIPNQYAQKDKYAPPLATYGFKIEIPESEICLGINFDGGEFSFWNGGWYFTLCGAVDFVAQDYSGLFHAYKSTRDGRSFELKTPNLIEAFDFVNSNVSM